MSTQLRKLIEKIVEIMRTEGIKWLEIRNDAKWNTEERRWEDTDDYAVNMSFSRTRDVIKKED